MSISIVPLKIFYLNFPRKVRKTPCNTIKLQLFRRWRLSDGRWNFLMFLAALFPLIFYKTLQVNVMPSRLRCITKLKNDIFPTTHNFHFVITDMREPVPPIMNDKLIQLTVRIDDVLVLPCVAYASPRPTYR